MKDRRTVGIVASIMVAALVIAGLFAVGSPAEARRVKTDLERHRRMADLHGSIAFHVGEQGSVPDRLLDLQPYSFEGFVGEFDPRRDPQTGELFEYRKIDSRQYEICASFLTDSGESPGSQEFENYYDYGIGYPLGTHPSRLRLDHRVGRNCYDRTISRQEIDNTRFEGQEPVLQLPAGEPPAPLRTAPAALIP
ncbi:MAG: hypothetical protein ACT4OM_12745 [Actinomycetota bacterium]